LTGNNALSDQVPWVTFKAKAWLESYLKPNMSVFEYGAGGSTIFLSRRVNKLVSIEDNKDWYDKISRVLSTEKISNCKYILCEPERSAFGKILPYSSKNYNPTAIECAGMRFENYVKSIERYPDRIKIKKNY